MRILHLIKHCNLSNGHVNVAVDLACVHAREGHAVAIGSAGGGFEDFLAANDVEHHRIAFGRSPPAMAGAVASVIRLCRRFRPDVIHAHMMSSAVLGYAASRLFRVPLVTTVHNSFDQHSGLMRLGDAVVAVSEAERRLLLSRGYPDAKVVTIRNGTVGSPRENMDIGNPLPDFPTPCVVTLCGLHERKGVHHLIAAFAQLADAYPAWHLNIIGQGPDAAKLQTQVAELGLNKRVHFLGGHRNPKRLLEQADIFVLASSAEPSALVLVEGRAAGCAMVATNVGGTAEALELGAAGQLVPPADPAAIASALDTLMASPARLQEWRRRARENLGPFGVERTAAKHLSLYTRLARQNSAPSRVNEVTPPAQ